MPEPMLIAKHGDVECFILPALCNRHGLITGATGTGKTVTLQVLSERLSSIGVPVFMADVKGDLAGLSQPGKMSPKFKERLSLLATTIPSAPGCRSVRSPTSRSGFYDLPATLLELASVGDGRFGDGSTLLRPGARPISRGDGDMVPGRRPRASARRAPRLSERLRAAGDGQGDARDRPAGRRPTDGGGGQGSRDRARRSALA